MQTGEALTLDLQLGDVLWYLSELCTRLEIRLEDVAERNVAKLSPTGHRVESSEAKATHGKTQSHRRPSGRGL